MITQLGLLEYRDKLVGRLSGGLKRRTIVATALTGQMELLILDEPSTGLDPVARRNVWAVLKQKVREGRTVILTTHYVEEAEIIADQVVIFNGGKVIVCDRPEAIRSTVSGLFRLTLKKEETSTIVNPVDPLETLQSMGLTNIKREQDDSLTVRVKAKERHLLSAIFDWAIKNRFVASISPITLEDAYMELVR